MLITRTPITPRPGTRRTATVLAGLSLAVAGLAPAAQAAPATSAPVTLQAQLKPSGDANGSGSVTFTLDKAKKRVCATATWRKIQKPQAAHIHKQSDGSIVVDLTGSVTGGKRCASGVSKRLIQKITDRPGRYYFNVHNATYPAGAIQGTLHK